VSGSDLESVIEEIRKDVVGRRCRVNITEVEKLALALSQLSRSLASLKGPLSSSTAPFLVLAVNCFVSLPPVHIQLLMDNANHVQ